MVPTWKEVMKTMFYDILDVLDEKPNSVCKVHFGEEFKDVLRGDVAVYVNSLMDEAMKSIDNCWIRVTIQTQNTGDVMSVWYEEDQRVVNGKISMDPQEVECMD
jgi:DNA-binding ferritin-like protein (Dps family)